MKPRYRISDQVLQPVGVVDFDDPEGCACGCYHCAELSPNLALSCARPECQLDGCRHRRTRLTERDSVFCLDCRSDIAVADG